MILITLLKSSMKNLKTLEKEHKITHHRTIASSNPETVTECDDKLLTADTELPLAEFRPDDNELEEEDEVLIDEPPPRNACQPT